MQNQELILNQLKCLQGPASNTKLELDNNCQHQEQPEKDSNPYIAKNKISHWYGHHSQ